MTRDEFMSKLIFEEKTWEIASNMDMVNRQQVCKLVTKNLLYLLHARRYFGINLDLDANHSIVDCVKRYVKEFVIKERLKINKEKNSAAYYALTESSVNKLFKRTLKAQYPQTLYKQVDKGRRTTTMKHFTVHDFNEALYSTIREFSSFVNFSQVENATFGFLMDSLAEESRASSKSRMPRGEKA